MIEKHGKKFVSQTELKRYEISVKILAPEQHSKIWQEGFTAEESGDPKNNPYPTGTPMWKAWDAGFEADQ